MFIKLQEKQNLLLIAVEIPLLAVDTTFLAFLLPRYYFFGTSTAEKSSIYCFSIWGSLRLCIVLLVQ